MDGVHQAMVEAIDAPAQDRFQLITEHSGDEERSTRSEKVRAGSPILLRTAGNHLAGLWRRHDRTCEVRQRRV